MKRHFASMETFSLTPRKGQKVRMSPRLRATGAMGAGYYKSHGSGYHQTYYYGNSAADEPY